MCYNVKEEKSIVEIEERYQVEFRKHQLDLFEPRALFNGFAYPLLPVITNNEPAEIQLVNWGLLPSWAKDMDIRKNTLNARIETIKEKPSFRSSVNNRCLIIVDGFYEWQWMDEKGKQKTKYLIKEGQSDIFSLAGLWNDWTNKETGEVTRTFTILTQEANTLMAEIHNTKKRMPVILKKEYEMEWLAGAPDPGNGIDLVAVAV
jgi:putative SOS response-associated peptidase YedK